MLARIVTAASLVTSLAMATTTVWGGMNHPPLVWPCPASNQWQTDRCGCTNIPDKPLMNSYDYKYDGQNFRLYTHKGCGGDIIHEVKWPWEGCVDDHYQTANSICINFLI
ncbi:hypothetical protein B0O80DRAFT_426905 [Mortierella sp. GBAus27b]|nr:hypothetical protein B0O80DRAFT_426905 [Mortierella sp. GBAus27b]